MLLFAGAGLAPGNGEVDPLLDDLHVNFGALDVNDDGWISDREYVDVTSGQDLMDRYRHFVRADITGDGRLGMDEFVYIGLIADEASDADAVRCKVSKTGFCGMIDKSFKSLQDRGDVVADEVVEETRRLLLDSQHGELQPDGVEALRAFYDLADFKRDGILNGNEVDFVRLLIRDAMLQTIEAQAASIRAELSEEIIKATLELHDKDGDGALDLEEAISAAVVSFSDDDTRLAPIVSDYAMSAFASSDANGDGKLERDEIVAFSQAPWFTA